MTGYFDSFLLSSIVAVFLGLISEKLADCISVDAYVSIVNLVMGQGQSQSQSQSQSQVATSDFNCDKPLPPEPVQVQEEPEQVQRQEVFEQDLLQQDPPKEQESRSESEHEVEQEVVQQAKQEVSMSSFSGHQEQQVEEHFGRGSEERDQFVAEEPVAEVVQEQVESLLESQPAFEEKRGPVEIGGEQSYDDDNNAELNIQVKQEPVDPYEQEQEEFRQQQEAPLMSAEQIKKEPFDPYDDHHQEEIQRDDDVVVKSEPDEDEAAFGGGQNGTAQHDVPAAFGQQDEVREELVAATEDSQDQLLQSQPEEPQQQQLMDDDFQATEQQQHFHQEQDELHQPPPPSSLNDDLVNFAASAPIDLPPATQEQQQQPLFDQHDLNVQPVSADDHHQDIHEEEKASVPLDTLEDLNGRGEQIVDDFAAPSNLAAEPTNIVRENVELEEERDSMDAVAAAEAKESSLDDLLQSDQHQQPEAATDSNQLLDFQPEPTRDQAALLGGAQEHDPVVMSDHDNQPAFSDVSGKEPSSSLDELLQDSRTEEKVERGQDLLQQEPEHFQQEQRDFQQEPQTSTFNDDLVNLSSAAPPAAIQAIHDEEVRHDFMDDKVPHEEVAHQFAEEDKHADLEGDSSSSPFDDLGATSSKPTSPGDNLVEEQEEHAKPFSPTTTALEDYELKSDGSGGAGDQLPKAEIKHDDDDPVKRVEERSSDDDEEGRGLPARHEEGGFESDPVNIQLQHKEEEQHRFEDDLMKPTSDEAVPAFSDQTDFSAPKPDQIDQFHVEEHQPSVGGVDFGKESHDVAAVETQDGTTNLQAPAVQQQQPRLSVNDDEDEELAAAALNDDDDDLSDPLEAEKMAYKAKVDEGDPWSDDKKAEEADAAPPTQALLGEGISSSSSAANLVGGGDDVSHRAVFGDEEDPDEKELDLSNKDGSVDDKTDLGITGQGTKIYFDK